METKVIKVEGMSCQHCVKAVEGALQGLAGVKEARVDLAAKQVQVQYEPEQVTMAQMKEAIEDQGYDVMEA